ncbi:MAG: hypothetical protein HY052_05125 [Proteobacteria bacterium]|nr:hypothetical protein [Pseudomonadota bacterium]
MIEPNTYNAGFYSAPVPGMAADQRSVADDAAAAADFARILSKPPSVGATPPPVSGTAGHSFLSFLKGVFDIINPLQHIPVIGSIYRHITGDEISPMAHLAGDTLYGGPIGAALAVADITYQKTTGKDIGETVIAALTQDKNKGPAAAPDGAMMAENRTGLPSHTIVAGKATDIVWNTPSTNSRLSPASSLPLLMGTNANEPVLYPTPTTLAPVLQAKGNVVPTFQPPTASKVDSTIVFHPQEAPALASRMDVRPELIAAKMMDALDKYRQMKSGPAGSMVSGIY